jgi:L-alanine-DL-glutamate epimerase-like enolase superfamily enzyme
VPAAETPIEHVSSTVYVIPTDAPESDGTLAWNSTTLVLARVRAGAEEGIGYTYSSSAAARVIHELLAPAIQRLDALAIPMAWAAMRRALRNVGEPGIAFNALSAVDNALWDLKGKLLDLPVVELLGRARGSVPLYGSGGFTSYDERKLCAQLSAWVEQGFGAVKMKVGRDPAADPERVLAARAAIGFSAGLFVDANGAYKRKQAAGQALRFQSAGVTWFEEPVSSEDLDSLRWLREQSPSMQIAAGEYGYVPRDFLRLLEAHAVDVLQADATRCGGINGFLQVGALVAARSLSLSAHCAPALHAQVGCALACLAHVEYFHDHVRIEQMLFDGCPRPQAGMLAPDLTRPGLGLSLKVRDAGRFEVQA